MITVFPRSDASWVDPAAEAEMRLLQDVAVACRMLKQTYGVSPAQSIAVELRIASAAPRALIETHQGINQRAAKVEAKIVAADGTDPAPAAPAGAAKAVVGADIEIVMPLGGLIDVAAEKGRIAKDIAKGDKEIAAIERKLGNADFLAKAPDDVVAEQKARLAEEQARRLRLVDALATLDHATGQPSGPGGPSGQPSQSGGGTP
jgi:valyl-tRNA synthetase